MSREEFEKKQKAICDFRYSLIAELANPYLPRGKLKQMIEEKAGLTYEIPYSTRDKVSAATIRKWLSLYKKYGKDILRPRPRHDRGNSRSITPEDQAVILNYLETHPHVPALTGLRELTKTGVIADGITSSSLFRFLTTHGFDLQNRSQMKTSRQGKKFNFMYPLECVQVDCMHTFKVPDEKNIMRKAILIAFLDDFSRRIVYSRFAFSERSLVFEQGIKHVLRCHGKIRKLYVDNGSTFISKQTKRILDILEVILIHSKPGRPQGRGKIERFFRTVQDQFTRVLDKDSITSLDDLNTRFRTWLETEYHRTVHRGLGKDTTPLDAWLSKTDYLIAMSESVDLDTVFMHEVKRRIYKDSTLTLDGVLYEAPQEVIGKSVRVYYDPLAPRRVLRVYFEGKYYGDAAEVDTYANTKVRRNDRSKTLDAPGADYDETAVSASLSASTIDFGGSYE